MSEHTERIASLKGKVIVITGGAGIIGKEFVRAVVEQEGIAVIADIDDKRGEKVKYSISKELNSTNIEFFEFDITSMRSNNI